jgi:hypothetical protein
LTHYPQEGREIGLGGGVTSGAVGDGIFHGIIIGLDWLEIQNKEAVGKLQDRRIVVEIFERLAFGGVVFFIVCR